MKLLENGRAVVGPLLSIRKGLFLLAKETADEEVEPLHTPTKL